MIGLIGCEVFSCVSSVMSVLGLIFVLCSLVMLSELRCFDNLFLVLISSVLCVKVGDGVLSVVNICICVVVLEMWFLLCSIEVMFMLMLLIVFGSM